MWKWHVQPGPVVIKLFSCSTQLSMKFFLLIHVKMPTVVGILTFMNGKNSILGLSEPKKSRISWYFYTYEHLKFRAQLSWARKKFYNLGARENSMESKRKGYLERKDWSEFLYYAHALSPISHNNSYMIFFSIRVLQPFQEYFTHVEPVVTQRWPKIKSPGRKTTRLP